MGSPGIRASTPSSATYSFCDLGHTSPLPESVLFSTTWADPCLSASDEEVDEQVTPEATNQREERRREGLGDSDRAQEPSCTRGRKSPQTFRCFLAQQSRLSLCWAGPCLDERAAPPPPF